MAILKTLLAIISDRSFHNHLQEVTTFTNEATKNFDFSIDMASKDTYFCISLYKIHSKTPSFSTMLQLHFCKIFAPSVEQKKKSKIEKLTAFEHLTKKRLF